MGSILPEPTWLVGRRQWQPTPVFLPGKSHGRRSLEGCSLWGHKESDTYWMTSLSLFTFMHWRRKWQPTPVFLPGESQGRRSLVGCIAKSRTQLSDWTELNWSDLAVAPDLQKWEYPTPIPCSLPVSSKGG